MRATLLSCLFFSAGAYAQQLTVIPAGWQFGVGTRNSRTSPVAGSSRATLLPMRCVNQRWPSGCTTMKNGQLSGVGMAYSSTAPLRGSRRPILLRRMSEYQTCPSGLIAMPTGKELGSRSNSRIRPSSMRASLPKNHHPFEGDQERFVRSWPQNRPKPDLLP